MKKLLIPITLIVICCFSGQPTSSQLDTIPKLELPKLELKVFVSVSCDDRTTKSMMLSHIKRELRSLPNVILVEREKATWILSLIAIPHTSAGRKTGKISTAIMSLYQFRSDTSIEFGIMDFLEKYDKTIFTFGKTTDGISAFKTMKDIANKNSRLVYNTISIRFSIITDL